MSFASHVTALAAFGIGVAMLCRFINLPNASKRKIETNTRQNRMKNGCSK
jgi:hypothetical protein